jgi:hypothetical protein
VKSSYQDPDLDLEPAAWFPLATSTPVCCSSYMLLPCSIISGVIQELNLTTIWPEDCVWISDEVCYANGTSEDFYNVTLQSVSDTCLPCGQSSYGCGSSPNNCGQLTNKFPEEFYGDNYCPGGCTFAPGSSYHRRRLASSRALLQNNGRPAAQAGTRAFEGFAGTLVLPNNAVRGRVC